MYDNRYGRDDLIPMLRDAGVADEIAPWLKMNASEEFLIELIQMGQGVVLLTPQLKQLISDLRNVAALDGADITGLPNAITRPAAPTSMGQNVQIVWFSSPDTGTMRWYKNGDILLTKEATIEKSIVKTEQGLVPGDVVQICQVSGGIAGWWARIVIE